MGKKIFFTIIMAVFFFLFACAGAQRASTGIGENVAAISITEGARPVVVKMIVPAGFSQQQLDLAWVSFIDGVLVGPSGRGGRLYRLVRE